ncbi:sulfite exporter TauE/SafE family protein [Dietzia alimentaria]|uniref:sulfite exporter TauE/SafE family protein n=1 Tax=Dietzia alimentaria TaxID=665550 RepID=UPI00029A9587|nr:sulfite exporter TauE/SafE family protein [Dietzia alimentaria]
MPEALLTGDSLILLVVSLAIGVVIGLTGMGGGALMTPALILVGIPPTVAVANDLVVNAVNKIIGAGVHWRSGKPNLRIAFWLVIGSVPTAFLGSWIIHAIGAEDVQGILKKAIGATLVVASTAYFLRAFFEMSGRIRTGDDPNPQVKPLITLLVGILGGLMVGITSVGSGTVIMMCIMLLYPTLSALRLVGTDLVQAVPLVIAAAIGHVMVTGVDWDLLLPLLVGGAIGTFIGSKFAGRLPQGLIRRGITIVLAVTAASMLGAPPLLIAVIALALVGVGPLVWRLLVRRYSAHLGGSVERTGASRVS